MTDLICIVCPKGCHLKVDEENGYKVLEMDAQEELLTEKKNW